MTFRSLEALECSIRRSAQEFGVATQVSAKDRPTLKGRGTGNVSE